MQKSAYAIVLIVALGTAAITTAVPYVQQVSADPDSKEKSWGNDQVIVTGKCDKADGGCKEFKEAFGSNINKAVRDVCESFSSGDKCKQVK